MLKDEIRSLNDERHRKLQIKEKRKMRIKNAFHNTSLYKRYQHHLKLKHERDVLRYEMETQKIIKKLPNKLKRLSRNYDYADIYNYEENLFIAPSLYYDMAKYYLDKRGKDIIQFLKNNDINYCLHTHNHVYWSCYTIRVNFDR